MTGLLQGRVPQGVPLKASSPNSQFSCSRIMGTQHPSQQNERNISILKICTTSVYFSSQALGLNAGDCHHTATKCAPISRIYTRRPDQTEPHVPCAVPRAHASKNVLYLSIIHKVPCTMPVLLSTHDIHEAPCIIHHEPSIGHQASCIIHGALCIGHLASS